MRRTSEERCACGIWSGACRTPAPWAIHRRSIGFARTRLWAVRVPHGRCEMLVGDVAQLAFRVLGSLEATVDGQPVRLTGRRERALLGVLLLNAGTVVSIGAADRWRLGGPCPAECPPHGARVRLAGSRGARRCDADLDPGARVHGRTRSRRARRRQLRRARAGGAPRARGDVQRGRASLVRRRRSASGGATHCATSRWRATRAPPPIRLTISAGRSRPSASTSRSHWDVITSSSRISSARSRRSRSTNAPEVS